METGLSASCKTIEDQSGLSNIEKRLETISPISKCVNAAKATSTRSAKKLSFNDVLDRVSTAYPSKKSSVSHIPTSSHSFIFEELGGLQSKIKEINVKLTENISLLKKKQEKNKELKDTIKKLEQRTLPTEISYEEANPQWACTKDCCLF